jgi:hypothetical protein
LLRQDIVTITARLTVCPRSRREREGEKERERERREVVKNVYIFNVTDKNRGFMAAHCDFDMYVSPLTSGDIGQNESS